jgi:histidine ammonia-lyase
MEASRRVVEGIVARGDTVYGVNTGFGQLARVRIGDADLDALQRNLVRSHACGVGPLLDAETVRAITLLRANVLAAGYSGVRPLVADRLLELLNRRIHAAVPSQGSVGASGDLAPLAHLALLLLGEGAVLDGAGTRPAEDVMAERGLSPIVLGAKEGLALINGTQLMAGLGTLVLLRASRLARLADAVASLTLEARLGSHRPFDGRLHSIRPQVGQGRVAAAMRRLLQGGTIHDSHRGCDRVQDAYSLRCIPQVHGASRDVIDHVALILSREINAVTDNPTVFVEDGDLLSGGNFHGQPVALALDYLAMGVAELASISERRIEQLVNPRLSELPPFLVRNSGLHSGFMIPQVVAAALVSENKVLAHPASIDSLPTSANQEDHVSMGPIAARKARQILENAEHVVAIEALCAAQAADLRLPLVPADGARAVRDAVRRRVPFLDEDRELHRDMAAIVASVRDGSLLREVEDAVGPLDVELP